MKKCKYCGEELDERASICSHCHKKQGLSDSQLVSIVFVVLIIPLIYVVFQLQPEKLFEENKKMT